MRGIKLLVSKTRIYRAEQSLLLRALLHSEKTAAFAGHVDTPERGSALRRSVGYQIRFQKGGNLR